MLSWLKEPLTTRTHRLFLFLLKPKSGPGSKSVSGHMGKPSVGGIVSVQLSRSADYQTSPLALYADNQT